MLYVIFIAKNYSFLIVFFLRQVTVFCPDQTVGPKLFQKTKYIKITFVLRHKLVSKAKGSKENTISLESASL